MKKKLHILFLCGWYPSRVMPTNGDFIQRHAEAVSKFHKVSVIHIVSDKSLNSKTEISKSAIRNFKVLIPRTKTQKNIESVHLEYEKNRLKLVGKISSSQSLQKSLINQIF